MRADYLRAGSLRTTAGALHRTLVERHGVVARADQDLARAFGH
jgi:hypothetical protein